MSTTQERSRINRILGSYGLPQLEDRGTLTALGFLVRDHDHLRQLLTACEPEQRHAMYQALAPHLSFEARPLDVYIAEAGALAESKHLPTIDPDSGQLREWGQPEIGSIQDAVAEAICKQKLWLVCRKCTREAVFYGHRKADAVAEARLAGWTYGLDAQGEGREICPDCPGPRGTSDVEDRIQQRKEFGLVTQFKGQPAGVVCRYMDGSLSASRTKEEYDKAALEAARRWLAAGKPTK